VAKPRTIFRCQVCGRIEAKWLGRCPACQTWDSLIEETAVPAPAPSRERGAAVVALSEVERSGEDRLLTGLGELDRVLGGGVMAGSTVLIGGDPGIGKSTLMLQVMAGLAGRVGPLLYVSGEESARQLRLRADRLGVDGQGLFLLTETGVDKILGRISQLEPEVLVLDSIQTLLVEGLPSTPGSLIQIRESVARFIHLAKQSGRPVFFIGHVTKSGALAGPRVVEHMVDTVLYFEGGQGHGFRVIRAVKNRFGSTNEIGVFEMREQGLTEVANPSALFLAERPLGQPGSAVVPCLQGSRPILVEVQALVAASAYASPRRTALGLDSGRVAMIAAVLEKKLGLSLAGQDVFVNLAGGLKVSEPGADLGLAAALASSLLDRAVDPETVLLGEVGLAGEVRAVSRTELRLAEAGKLGFKRALVPARVARQLDKAPLELIGVSYLSEAIKKALE